MIFAAAQMLLMCIIRYLRKKIDDGFPKKLIHTIRGAGYVLKEDE